MSSRVNIARRGIDLDWTYYVYVTGGDGKRQQVCQRAGFHTPKEARSPASGPCARFSAAPGSARSG